MYHRVETDSPLHRFLTSCLEAYRERTSQWSNISVLHAIDQLDRKVDGFMATQEERLQEILLAVKNVKTMLADLKVNNPAPEPTPEPAPEEGGGVVNP